MSRSHRMAMIDRVAPELSVRRQCALLGLARSGVYRVAPAPDPQDLALMRRLDALYLELPFYGSRRMMLALKAEGHAVNRKRVQRLMRTMGLEALVPRPGTSWPAPGHQVHPYLLKGLMIERANQVWAADITYIPMARGFLYLVAVMDWASRAVLAWRLSNTLDVAFCVEALEGALARHGRPEIFNTDQGAQFTSAVFTGRLKQAGVAISMDGRGRWLDNVFVERLWRSLKYEEVHLKAYGDGREARAGIGAWINFYNERRPHQALAYRTPMGVWRAGVTAVDMTLRLDDAGASPPCPQPHQHQAA
jgi:putative transposase